MQIIKRWSRLWGEIKAMDKDRCARLKIYCAGPLFNELEKQEMGYLAKALEDANYETFLPHRDGLEFSKATVCMQAKGISISLANSILSKAIFALDVFQVVQCDGLVLNMNGRVPDEGAMVEAGIAWACQKKIVIFKNDARTLLNGADNPLVIGLSNFKSVSSSEEVAREFSALFEHDDAGSSMPDFSFTGMVEKGKIIHSHMAQACDIDTLCETLLSLFGHELAHAQSQ